MSAPAVAWSVRLSTAAETDFRKIVRWSAREFGGLQARTYARTLSLAIEALANGPEIVGVRRREDIGRGLMSLHVARGRRKGRLFVIFRAGREGEQRFIEVLRLLHDAMDTARHIPADAPDG